MSTAGALYTNCQQDLSYCLVFCRMARAKPALTTRSEVPPNGLRLVNVINICLACRLLHFTSLDGSICAPLGSRCAKHTQRQRTMYCDARLFSYARKYGANTCARAPWQQRRCQHQLCQSYPPCRTCLDNTQCWSIVLLAVGEASGRLGAHLMLNNYDEPGTPGPRAFGAGPEAAEASGSIPDGGRMHPRRPRALLTTMEHTAQSPNIDLASGQLLTPSCC